MHAIFCNLTAASLLIHAMIGCCWHHAHECAACDHQHGASAIHDEASHADEGCEHNGQFAGQHAGHPCKCNVECQGVCTYLTTQESEKIAVRIAAPANLVANVPGLAEPNSRRASAQSLATDFDLPPPLRLHLLHQILLI